MTAKQRLQSTSLSIPTPTAQFVGAEVVAQKYSVSGACVRLWAKTGKIPSIKFQGSRRFDLEAVAAVIEGK